jgi:hypothetical protein
VAANARKNIVRISVNAHAGPAGSHNEPCKSELVANLKSVQPRFLEVIDFAAVNQRLFSKESL